MQDTRTGTGPFGVRAVSGAVLLRLDLSGSRLVVQPVEPVYPLLLNSDISWHSSPQLLLRRISSTAAKSRRAPNTSNVARASCNKIIPRSASLPETRQCPHCALVRAAS